MPLKINLSTPATQMRSRRYTYGLSGSDIPLAGRIVIIADQYDALRNSRVYKPALSHEMACDIILNGDGRYLFGHS